MTDPKPTEEERERFLAELPKPLPITREDMMDEFKQMAESCRGDTELGPEREGCLGYYARQAIFRLIESSPEPGEKRGEEPVLLTVEEMGKRFKKLSRDLVGEVALPAPSPGPSAEVCDYCGKAGKLTYADDGKLYHEFCIARIYEIAQGHGSPAPGCTWPQ